jgi:hypothetical protein
VKLSIGWNFLYEAGYISQEELESLNNDVKTIIGTLVNIINKIKEK